MTPFDYINSVTDNKKNLITESDNPEFAEKSYEPFMVNRGLSLFSDTILWANEMNRYPELDKKLQYEFYLHALRKRKRFSKWPKKEKSDDINLISKHYKYNRKRAIEALGLMTEDQLKSLRKIYGDLK